MLDGLVAKPDGSKATAGFFIRPSRHRPKQLGASLLRLDSVDRMQGRPQGRPTCNGAKPLEGITVVVTRAASQAEELSTLLESYGAKVIVCPTIEIREPENYDRLDEALDHLYGYDWLIFTSTNGVDFFIETSHRRAD